ncbi:MAG TPA: hypothetical protein DEB32_13505, partial [Stenotrophomonas sp.]|nr:hypothetical protein [Stenotrophomonas sp.]
MDLSHPLEQISERGLLPKRPFPGPADLPLVGGAFYLGRCQPHGRPGRPPVATADCLQPALWPILPARSGESAMSDLFALAMPWWE